MENDDRLEEIRKLVDIINKETILDNQMTNNSTIDTTQWNLGNTMNYVPYPFTSTFHPLTTTQIQNMGIGTTGSMAGPDLTFDLGKIHNKEFETHLPGIHKINELREMFPGFKKAWDHMRTIYDLVNEEYIERKKPL